MSRFTTIALPDLPRSKSARHTMLHNLPWAR